ncbi:MAG: DNA mismatch repair protein MutS, partial [Chitinophagaceae bacterium]|nr:DNA mismatch repair protein MutS [Chitinophagaceae bacterium]
MKLYPESAAVQLEFDKICQLLADHTRSAYARSKALDLRIHTRLEYIERELDQAATYLILLQNGQYFPNDTVLNIEKELKLLGIPGAVLKGEDFIQVRRLAIAMHEIFRWFEADRQEAYPALYHVVKDQYYEPYIEESIDAVMDETGQVRDDASPELAQVRMSLFRKRNELRRSFEKILQKLNKAGYIADIEEAFLNGRRVVAIYAEHKRQVKGILHGESDTRRTSFIEPEETIELNNDIYSLENEERAEVHRILRNLTAALSGYAPMLKGWLRVLGEYDFIRAKARLASDLDAHRPQLQDRSGLKLIRAYHPLLWMYNKKSGKPIVPVDLELNPSQRILVISGPNAGGKTVTLKTVGLLQMMIQGGLLVPVHPDSSFGIFKQLMIHIGDTQSLEFELSTYSAHLSHMKYLMEEANGRTLFFIDELGSGSDPSLGGTFAEVFLEELVRKHAMGIVTTHYLNLKVMAGKTPGIVNGAMSFDEKNLLPLYKLNIGKPGSSYTFSIAERIGLEPRLINRARHLVDENHFKLDNLLNQTEQDLRKLGEREEELKKLMKENERLKKEMERVMDREKHRQQVELLRQQNRVTEERIAWLKDTERKIKQIVFDWRRAERDEDKSALMRQLHALLFRQKEKQVKEKVRKKLDARYELASGEARPGDKVLMKQNNQVGTLSEIRGKKAIVQLGSMPLTVEYGDLAL